MSLFAEKGYNGTSIDDIADRADVARATVFNYFHRKEAFLDAWTASRQEFLQETITRQRSRRAGTREQLRECMKALAESNEGDVGVARTLVAAWVYTGRAISEEPRTAYIFSEIIAEGITRGDIRDDVVPELAGTLIRDLYLGCLYRWVGGTSAEPPFSLRDRLLTLLDILLEGLTR